MLTSEFVKNLKLESSDLIKNARSSVELDDLRQKIFGKKGTLTLQMKSLGTATPEQRKELGQLLNITKVDLEQVLTAKSQEILAAETTEKLKSDWIDVTLPVSVNSPVSTKGSLHPLTHVQREVEQIFVSLGFTVVDGPEVETEYYNFDALNVPATHPARDMQDTFWTVGDLLLRTQTSNMQIRAMEEMKAPLRIVAPGRCFRYERSDATHENTFYQMEGMMIDKVVTVGHLIYFMKTLLRELFGFEPKIRLRPGFFPFVEPGFELDIWFNNRWMELLPCGLTHPKVLEYGGIDSKKWQGFAFGLGLSRLVMSRFEIDDIRHLQGADLRFLKQF